ncbi:MAG: MarR family winged helix-turn-helix transcriptional regulator [Rhizobiaceae bacterium]
MTAGVLDLGTIPKGASRTAIAVFRLSIALRMRLGRKLRDAGDLTIVEWRILVGISTMAEASQRDLVAFSKAEQAQVSRCLKDMEGKGLVLSRPNRDDRRARLYEFTAEGKKLFDRLLPQVSDHNQVIDAALNDEEISQFLDYCERLATAALGATVNESEEERPKWSGQPIKPNQST